MCEISIIVAVYNVEKYIEKCIESILVQTFSDIEIILVDDGSNDESAVVCEKYRMRDQRIKVIHKKNGGLSTARNIGIEVAQGKYIGFIDGDDYISEDMYELLYNNIIKEDADISICGIFNCYEGHKPLYNKYWYGVMNAQDAIYYAFEGKRFSVNAVNKLYRKDLFENVRYPEGKTAEDAFVIIGLFEQCSRIVATTEQKYFYYHRKNSITTNSIINGFDCIEAYKRNAEIIKMRFPEIEEIALSRLCWANFYALDRLLLVDNMSRYVNNEREIVTFLKSKTWFILVRSRLTKSRKLALIVLLFGRKLYKAILYFNNKYRKNLNS